MVGVLIRSALLVTLLVLLPGRAEAQYLDPGAGSIVVQAVVAALIGAATVLKLYWGKIKGLFGRRARDS